MTAPVLFRDLVDDAGLFPPEELPMAGAVARFRAQHSNPIVTGRFLCPSARLPECLAQVEAGERLTLAVITSLEPDELDAALATIATEPRLALRSIEGVQRADRRALGVARAVPVYVELPISADLEDDLDWLATHGLRAKIRCGGLRRELFPTPAELARFVRACADRGVPFKATAGLHHAIAHTDFRTGFDHHGFLNLLVAAARAVRGATVADVETVLATTHTDALVAQAGELTDDDAARARELFVCYGSCSTTEPLEDLVSLGLVDESASALELS